MRCGGEVAAEAHQRAVKLPVAALRHRRDGGARRFHRGFAEDRKFLEHDAHVVARAANVVHPFQRRVAVRAAIIEELDDHDRRVGRPHGEIARIGLHALPALGLGALGQRIERFAQHVGIAHQIVAHDGADFRLLLRVEGLRRRRPRRAANRASNRQEIRRAIGGLQQVRQRDGRFRASPQA